MINVSDHNISYTNGYYRDETPLPKYLLVSNSAYTLSFNYNVNIATKYLFASVGYGNVGFQRDIISSSGYTGNGKLIISFTTPDTFAYNPPYVSFRFARMVNGDADVDVSHIQLEEGSVATAYEPYYILDTTTVVQQNNHTLRAIWEAN